MNIFAKYKKLLTSQFLFVFSVIAICFVIPAHFVFAGPAEFAIDIIGKIIYGICTTIGGFFLSLGGVVLDISINHLVIGMGDRFITPDGGTTGIGTLVNDFWSMVRDLLNILFIFGFIFIGIKTILNSDDSGTKRSLGLLIVAALLINFSLYVTQAIVDFSNILSLQVYNQIVVDAGSHNLDAILQPGSKTISGAFLEAARIESFFTGEGIDAVGGGVNIIVFSLFMMFFLIIAGLVFFYGGILIITRFVALVLYMVFSPLMFLGWIMPNFNSITKKWWNGFFKQSFFAPVYLFLIFLSLKVTEVLISHVGKGASFTSAFDTKKGVDMDVSGFIMIIYFLAMVGFLYASIKVAQMMSISGANMAMGGMKHMQGLVYRNTAGRLINRFGVSTIDNLDKAAQGGNGAAGFTRALIGGEGTRRAAVKARDYGAGGVGRADQEKMDSERKSRATSSIEFGKIADVVKSKDPAKVQEALQGATNSQIVDLYKNKDTRDQVLANANVLSKSKIEALEKSDDIDATAKATLLTKRSEQVAEKLREDQANPASRVKVEDASKEQLAILGPSLLSQPEYAVRLSKKQVDDLDFVEAYKNQIKDARKDAIVRVAGGENIGGYTQADLLKGKPEDIADLPKDVFENDTFTNNLSIASLENIYRKHNKGTQATIRMKLQQNARNGNGASPREQVLYDFLNTDRVGKNFGK